MTDPSSPSPISPRFAAVVEAAAAVIESDDDNPYCTYANTAERLVRTIDGPLLEAVVAELNMAYELDLSHASEEQTRTELLDILRPCLARLLATPVGPIPEAKEPPTGASMWLAELSERNDDPEKRT